jgi:hypothetical protein
VKSLADNTLMSGLNVAKSLLNPRALEDAQAGWRECYGPLELRCKAVDSSDEPLGVVSH